MLTREEALAIVSKRLAERSDPGNPAAVNDAKTLEKPFGWVFFYNSKRFLETGDSHYRFAGNGPIIVNKQDGTVHFFGPKPLIEIIAEYERGLEDTPELPPEEIP